MTRTTRRREVDARRGSRVTRRGRRGGLSRRASCAPRRGGGLPRMRERAQSRATVARRSRAYLARHRSPPPFPSVLSQRVARGRTTAGISRTTLLGKAVRQRSRVGGVANGLGAANEDAPMSPSPLVVGRGRRGRRWLRRSGDRRAAAPRRGRALPPARRARAARRPCRRPARACAARGARPAVPYRRRPDRARARAGELRTAPRATSAEAVGLGRGAAPAPRTAYARLLDTQNTISQGSFVFF